MNVRAWALMIVSVAILVINGTAGAHGTGQHIMGTVTAISDAQIDVKTPKGRQLSVRLTDKTTFQPRGKETSGTRPQVGDRVVIEASGTAEELTATEIMFSSASGPPKTGRR